MAKKKCEFRLTFAGLLFVVLFLLVGTAAVNTQRAMLFVMFGLMLAAFFYSLFATRRMLMAVDVHRDMPQRSFASRVVHLSYSLRQLRKSAGPAIGLELEEMSPPAQWEGASAYCLYLPAAGSFQSGSRFVVHDRGKYTLTRMRLSTAFPFRLVRGNRYFAQEDSLMVWPALGTLKVDLFQRGAAEVSDFAPSQVGSGADEFFGLREYRQGDNPRWIHWKRSAAKQSPVVKEMSRPRPDVLYIILDTQLSASAANARSRDSAKTKPGQPSEEHATREKLIRLAATLTEQAFRREYRVGLATAYSSRPVCLPAGAGIGQRIAVLDALACIDDNREIGLARLIAAIPARLLQFAQVVVIAQDKDRLQGLTALGAACQHAQTITPEQVDAIFDDAVAVEPADADHMLDAAEDKTE